MASDWNKWQYQCKHCEFGCSAEKLLEQHIAVKHPETIAPPPKPVEPVVNKPTQFTWKKW
jgi:hypothetical protein